MLNEIIEIRRKLHMIPEIGFKEFKTSNIIKEYLTNYGYDFEEIAHTGLIAIKRGKENSSIAFRSDMDGLQVEEKTNLSFASTHDGQMHACGHDAHMAMLLGFAGFIAKQPSLNKNIVFIFQPAEEGPGGAEVIVKEGILSKYNIKAIFGIHMYPGLTEGKIGLLSGPMMAQNGEINITIKAKSAHGAMPHLGIDAIYIASQLIQAYQSIVSRNIEPIEGAIVTLGRIYGGEARNVIANEVNLEGTVRAFNPLVFQTIKSRIFTINKGLEEMFNVNIETDFKEYYPPVNNDENLYNIVKNCLEPNEYESIKPMMLSEDFSFYQQVVPGLFMMLGTRNEEKGYIHPLHSCYFNFNEEVLLQGVKTYIKISKALKILD